MAARKFQYAAEPQPFWEAESKFVWRAALGPHRAVARWGKEERTVRLSVPAARGREVKPVPRRRVRPVRGIVRWGKMK